MAMSTESFKLPAEFEGFVSNADSLLQQFQRVDIEDAVTVSIYCDSIMTKTEALAFLDTLTAAIEELSKLYIWFKDSLKLFLVVPDDKNIPSYFTGKVHFSDSIEDEWFITYIAYKLSVMFKELCITVTDTDGQFLLIEAADYIPDWIDPENCENRIWIRQGQIYIVPIDEAGRNIQDGGIKLSSALDCVRNRPRDSLASKQVQSAIEQVTLLAKLFFTNRIL